MEQRGTQNQWMDKSRGGLTTNILALVDAPGNRERLGLIPGRRDETTGVAALLEWLNFSAPLGAKVHDAAWLPNDLKQRGVEAVISTRAK
jgi:hypothetical protein